jgi:hypothetical protein
MEKARVCQEKTASATATPLIPAEELNGYAVERKVGAKRRLFN